MITKILFDILVLLLSLFCHSFCIKGIISHLLLLLFSIHLINAFENIFLLHLLIQSSLIVYLLSFNFFLSSKSLSSVDLCLMMNKSFPFINNSIVIFWKVLFSGFINSLNVFLFLVVVLFPALRSKLQGIVDLHK